MHFKHYIFNVNETMNKFFHKRNELNYASTKQFLLYALEKAFWKYKTCRKIMH